MPRVLTIATFILLPLSHTAAETCSSRASVCLEACTPQAATSGTQLGGTAVRCRASCQSRLNSCLRTGIWIQMGPGTPLQHQHVEKR
jgi:hypothetical protein